jgi:hypothetical protein
LIAYFSDRLDSGDSEISTFFTIDYILVAFHTGDVLEDENIRLKTFDLVDNYEEFVVARIVQLVVVISTAVTLAIRDQRLQSRYN